jgi:DNA-binding MarR family transcriptional regulator
MLRLLKAVYWFDEALQKGLEARGWKQLTRPQSLVLMNVAVGVVRPSEIARNLGVTRQAIGQTLADMEARGILVTCDDPTDARARRVGFTPGSAAMRDDAVAILARIEERLADRIGSEQLVGLREALSAEWGESPST